MQDPALAVRQLPEAVTTKWLRILSTSDEVCGEIYSFYRYFWQIRNIATSSVPFGDTFSSRRRLRRSRARGFIDTCSTMIAGSRFS